MLADVTVLVLVLVLARPLWERPLLTCDALNKTRRHGELKFLVADRQVQGEYSTRQRLLELERVSNRMVRRDCLIGLSALSQFGCNSYGTDL